MNSFFLNIFYLHSAIKKTYITEQWRGKKYKRVKKKQKPKDYKINYICTYVPQLKKEKKYKATFNNPLTAKC